MRPLFPLCQTRTMRLAVVFALFCLLGGCAKKNPFLGSWDSEVDILKNKVAVVHTFGQEGLHDVSFTFAGVKGQLVGKYEFEGDKLTITPDSFNVDTSGSFLPKSVIDQGKAEVDKTLDKPQTGTVAWISADEFTVTPEAPGIPLMHFKRQAAAK